MFTITNCFAEFPRTQKRYSEKVKLPNVLSIRINYLVELNMFKEPDGEECKIVLGNFNTMPEMAGYKYS